MHKDYSWIRLELCEHEVMILKTDLEEIYILYNSTKLQICVGDLQMLGEVYIQ
jgi:hypothetical protein